MKEIRLIEEKLREKQKASRYVHTTGVRYTSVCLAMRYGEDLVKAEYAGLLHDSAKHMSGDKLLDKALKHGLPVSDVERRNPFLLHGKVGAYISKKHYDVTDQDILNAIIYHTTGRPEMSLLEKIVYVADYIEPGRDKAPNLAQLRQVAFTDLDLAVYMILEQTLSYLQHGEGELDPQTEITWRYYKQLIEERQV